MSDSPNKPHISFWLIGVLALLWNLMTAINFVGQTNAEFIASMPESHQAIIEGRPLWGTLAFAIAAFGGLAGGVLLLLRKGISLYLFLASLLGVMVQMFPNLKLAGEIQFGPGELFMMMVMPLVVAAFLTWYANQTKTKGWLK